jgi:peroxiredoxin Q/BCP
MAKLDVGDPAPDFTLEGTEGSFTLSEHRGELVVLLFYPGDDTTVCTKQFCSYRDAQDDIDQLDATLVGISTQGMESKQAFKAKYGLTTPLLADPDGTVSKLYGSYAGPLKVAKRTVFIVDEQGRIAYQHGNFLSLSYDSADELRSALDQVRGRAPAAQA